ncbi:MAG: hypothetical protein AAGK00_09230 [Pseudomonadota bacterium]
MENQTPPPPSSSPTNTPSQTPRVRSKAMILLILGVVMLMPPVATIFHLESKILGVPITLLYLMAAWAALILGAALLSRQLMAISDRQDAP